MLAPSHEIYTKKHSVTRSCSWNIGEKLSIWISKRVSLFETFMFNSRAKGGLQPTGDFIMSHESSGTLPSRVLQAIFHGTNVGLMDHSDTLQDFPRTQRLAKWNTLYLNAHVMYPSETKTNLNGLSANSTQKVFVFQVFRVEFGTTLNGNIFWLSFFFGMSSEDFSVSYSSPISRRFSLLHVSIISWENGDT